MIKKKLKFIIVWSLLTWSVMMPLLLFNYLLLGEIAMFFSVMANFIPTIAFFYTLTLFFAFTSYIASDENGLEKPLTAGILRWLFILATHLIVHPLLFGDFSIFQPNYILLIFVELPLMVFSYWVGFEVTKRLLK